MAQTDAKVVAVRELRFKPANSNDRARAGLEHAFADVPACFFAKDDGISPYIGANSTIGTYPENPATLAPAAGDVPDVAQEGTEPTALLGHKLLRSGFGLSVFLHAAVALGVGYATIQMPDQALLEGETVIAIEFFSETDSDVTTQVKQDKQEGKEEAQETAAEQPKQEVAEPLKEPIKPLETSVIVKEPLLGANVPEALSTTQPSDFQVEAAAKQILDEVKIEPLPDALPPALVTPVREKVAEVKPMGKSVQKPVSKKEKPEPKKTEPKKEETKKPEPKPDKKRVKKKVVAREGDNADSNSRKGSSTAKQKDGNNRDASQGKSKRKVKGNAAFTNYKGLIQKKLSRAKKRVSVSAKGNVEVGFTINADGSVSNLRVTKSSGKPEIDRGALEVVRRASPFPAIPPETGMTIYRPTQSMTFKGN